MKCDSGFIIVPDGNCSVDLGYLCNIDSIEDLRDCENPEVLTLRDDKGMF